jgi:hypothetical protein
VHRRLNPLARISPRHLVNAIETSDPDIGRAKRGAYAFSVQRTI